jgi:SAM-dependent methyltransferase
MSTIRTEYVHGYEATESERLIHQAVALSDLLHHDTRFPPGSLVLEAGCGVGAQTLTIASRNPRVQFCSVDISCPSLSVARRRVNAAGLMNVSFGQADIHRLPFVEGTFDHVFLCFVLEHLREPVQVLVRLRRLLKPGGTIMLIEGDHGSAFFHPPSDLADRAIQCLVDLQARSGGDGLIGRRLYPLLIEAGYRDVNVSPRFVYADDSRPEMVEGFTRQTFTAMVAGVREPALAEHLMSESEWEQAIADLNRTAEAGGTFCYTFFKAAGVR